MPDAPATIEPARPNRWWRNGFAWYAERLLRKEFAALRTTPEAEAALARMAAESGPQIVVMSHASWWDPVLAAFLWRRSTPTREVYAPIDRRSLAQFRFLRSLGLFGVDPDDPRSLEAIVDYAEARVREASAARREIAFWLTPQGRFTDVRTPARPRPGAAVLAARLGVGRVWAIAVEYAFWNERRPEVFLHASEVVPARRGPAGRAASASDWQRAIAEGMDANRVDLARRVIARDATAFVDRLGGTGGVHPVYDLWLRLRGVRRTIDCSHRPAAAAEHAARALEGTEGGAARWEGAASR